MRWSLFSKLREFAYQNVQLGNSLSQWLFTWCIAICSVLNFFITHKSFQGISNVYFDNLDISTDRTEFKPNVKVVSINVT